MFAKIISGSVTGVCACLIGVEVDMDRGLPAFSMVGSLAGEVRESRERVSVALKNSGFTIPPTKITINLAPGDVHKEGTGFDLAIAVGILQAMSYFTGHATEQILFIGELGLNGEVKKVQGVLPIVQAAKAAGIRQCIVPAVNAGEGAVIPGIKVRGAEKIGQVLAFLQQQDSEEQEYILPRVKADGEMLLHRQFVGLEDFAQVQGQKMARRAAEIAVAGFHNLLMVGPPGAGKSMIAERMRSILPPLTLQESLEVTGIYSVAGLLEEGEALITKRPFLNPHHSITPAALTGGKLHPKPGMISLAHRGV